ncbi:MAG: PAS domain-containing protein, partial [Spirochaetota bacterium]
MNYETISRDELIAEIERLRLAEEASSLFRRRIQKAVDSNSDCIWITDSEERIVFFNEALRRTLFLLYGTELVPGMRLADVVPPEKFPPEYMYWKEFYDRSACEQNFPHEFSFIEGDSIRHNVITRSPVEGGGLIFFARDITLLREAEDREYEATALTGKILEASTIGILTYNSAGRCVSANSAAGSILGAGADALLNENIYDSGSWKSCGISSAAKDVLAGSEGVRLTVKTESAHNRILWLECRLMPFVSRSSRNLLLIINDITESRQIEEDTNRIMHGLKQSNAELETFAYVASHDLQEPLRVIASYLQLIERRYADRLDDKGKDFILRTVNA